MNFIEKHSKILAVSLCLLTSGPIVSTMYAKEVQPGWHGEGADRYYVLKSIMHYLYFQHLVFYQQLNVLTAVHRLKAFLNYFA